MKPLGSCVLAFVDAAEEHPLPPPPSALGRAHIILLGSGTPESGKHALNVVSERPPADWC